MEQRVVERIDNRDRDNRIVLALRDEVATLKKAVGSKDEEIDQLHKRLSWAL